MYSVNLAIGQHGKNIWVTKSSRGRQKGFKGAPKIGSNFSFLFLDKGPYAKKGKEGKVRKAR